MREQGHEGDKQLAACIETDRIGCLFFQSLSTVVEGLDKLEHGAGFVCER
jgi:hypothetical protein